MSYNVISYLIGDGIKNIAKNKKSTFTAITIMVVTMLTVGICLVIGENAKAILNEMENEYPIEVYIMDGTTDEEKALLKDEIKSIEYVNPDNIKFINKRDAYYLALEKLGNSAASAEMAGYTEEVHPFPESYSITLTDLEKLDEVVYKIEQLEHVKSTSESKSYLTPDESETNNATPSEENLITEVSTNVEQSDIATTSAEPTTENEEQKKSPAETLTKFSKGVNITLIAIGGVLVVFSIIIIGNTIKLTVHARRKEISIMKYVGATNNFIRAPFVVEGIIIGVISSLISILLLGGIYIWIKRGIIGGAIQSWLKGFNNMATGMDDLLQFEQMFPHIMVIFLVIGIGIGVLGSMLSMKKYLKV